MKLFVQETRSSLIKKYLFADNDVTMQWLPLSGKFVHKANASPKCYKMLKKTLALPGISTLKSYLKRVDIKPGFHENIFDALRCKAEHMSTHSKLCAILFEEMSIKERVSYDVSNDNVCGLEDFGTGGRTRYVANHAGVFMVRGLVDKQKHLRKFRQLAKL